MRRKQGDRLRIVLLPVTSKTSPGRSMRAASGTNGMDGLGQSGSQLSSLYPPITYASPAADCLVRLLAFLRRTGCIRR